jgi:putative endonuclease
MRIIARNVREKFAEIDIVAEDRDTLCFVEVRTRKDTLLGHPVETITEQKQRSVRRAAEAYLVRHNILNRAIRFDVATIVWSSGEYQYLENAF